MNQSSNNFVSRPRSSSFGNRRYYGGRARRPYYSRRPRNSYRGGGSRNFGFDKISHDKYIAKAEGTEMPSIYETNQKFENFNINGRLKVNLSRQEYTTPTKIQSQAIPEILNGKDVLGLASTGSGKTAAFLVPMINKAMRDPSQKCLIIVPTRELANQIDGEFYKLTFHTNLQSAVVIGGASMYRQIQSLQRGPQFIVGTPGRLKDLSERKNLRLGQFNNVVLDEVDRMLDMGFIHDIRELMSQLQGERQTLFFSATMSPRVEVIANSFLCSPVRIQVEKQSPAKNVDQDIVKVRTNSEKIEKLQNLLRQDEFEKVLIFSRTKRGTDHLSVQLNARGFKVDAIHGNKSQNIRTKVINKFRNNVINILVATDVAARGLDIPAITHVINYDEPANYDDYIHRVGRTGRVGKKGFALTFVI